MKIFSKFKKFSRDIKAMIIGALIMSCFGVYAAGTCIISATADDVTYNGTTVQAAIDELYSMAESYCPEGYECRQLKYVTDCDNKKIYSTTPDNLTGLAKIMAESAYLDSGKSEYVSSCNGVNIGQISSDTNGKGIYEIASTKNDTYPIYYYRGTVDNNNVKFGGFCWKAIRTTDTGGVKMIYNGEPDGSGNCTNTTGESTQIGESTFSITAQIFRVGYMNGKGYSPSTRASSNLSTAYVYGNDIIYSGGTYTLTDTMTSTGDWSADYNTLSSHHYTCFSTGNTCTSVYYIYDTTSSYANFITLTNGEKIEDALDEMFSNSINSIAKTQVDNWYNSNLSSYTSYIEDTVYCNDRSISDLGEWNPDGGSTTSFLWFSPYTRTWTNYTPSLECNRAQDRLTVSSSKGNGALTYPVGLITSDEVMYAGGRGTTSNTSNTYYLYTNQNYWTMSPCGSGSIFKVSSSGCLGNVSVYTTSNVVLRPVISLSPNAVISSGDGTSTNPYVIETS